MTVLKIALYAVVGWFLYRLYVAKKAGASTPDALRSQIPFVGEFLARAAEPPAAGSAAPLVNAVVPASEAQAAPNQSALTVAQPASLPMSVDTTSIMGRDVLSFTNRTTRPPLLATGGFVTGGTPAPSPLQLLTGRTSSPFVSTAPAPAPPLAIAAPTFGGGGAALPTTGGGSFLARAGIGQTTQASQPAPAAAPPPINRFFTDGSSMVRNAR